MACRCIHAGCRRENRSGRDAHTFSYGSEVVPETLHNLSIPLTKPTRPEFLQEPVTLGEHLRRRRLELKLYQKEVASRIGVTASTIWNWEHGATVELRHTPGVIAFLGYNPIPCPDDPLGKLAWYKLVNGLTLEQLGAEMGRDPEQLADWLSGRNKPIRRNLEEIEKFLAESIPDKKRPSEIA